MNTQDQIFHVLETIVERNVLGGGADIRPELVYLTQLLQREFTSPDSLGEADVWHEGSQSFYRAKLLKKLTPEDAMVVPPEVDSPSELDIDPVVHPSYQIQLDEPDYFAPNVRRMVDRFLTWKLPKNFSPDGYVSFNSTGAKNNFFWPVGTNILDAEQTREMFMYALDYTKDSVIGEIEAERYRQIYEEGHTFHHDDEHDQGELYRAAICYMTGTPNLGRFDIQWPWEMSSWKPSTDRRKELIKAAALLVAEIERIDRLNNKCSQCAGSKSVTDTEGNIWPCPNCRV